MHNLATLSAAAKDIEARLRERKAFFRNGAAWLMSPEPDPDCIAAADAIAAMRRKTAEVLTISIARRLDGGIRVWSDDLPGLILSGSDPEKVMADVWPAVQTLLAHRGDADG